MRGYTWTSILWCEKKKKKISYYAPRAATWRKRTFRNVRPTKTQISLIIRTVWSESSLPTQRNITSLAMQNALNGDSDDTAQMRSLIRIFTGQIVFEGTSRFLTLRFIQCVCVCVCVYVCVCVCVCVCVFKLLFRQAFLWNSCTWILKSAVQILDTTRCVVGKRTGLFLLSRIRVYTICISTNFKKQSYYFVFGFVDYQIRLWE